MPRLIPAGILPRAAIRYLRQKRRRPSDHWSDVWREEHAVAFTVAQMARDAMLREVQQALVDALREGETMESFRDRLGPWLEQRGWAPRGRGGDIPTRLKRIYNTNLRTARTAGQWDRISRNADLLPYLVYELGPSEAHREEHAAWAGLCLKVDDPFWNTHYPPNGWGCKCRVRQVAEPPPGSTTRAPDVELREWTNPATGEVREVAVGIDPGWDYHVGAQRTLGVNLGWLRRVERAARERGSAAAARMVGRHVEGPGYRWFVGRPRTTETARLEARRDLVEATPVGVLPEAAAAELGAAVVRLTEPAMHAQLLSRAGVPARVYARLQELLDAKPRRLGESDRWVFERTVDVGGERRRAQLLVEVRDGALEVVSLTLDASAPRPGRRRRTASPTKRAKRAVRKAMRESAKADRELAKAERAWRREANRRTGFDHAKADAAYDEMQSARAAAEQARSRVVAVLEEERAKVFTAEAVQAARPLFVEGRLAGQRVTGLGDLRRWARGVEDTTRAVHPTLMERVPRTVTIVTGDSGLGRSDAAWRGGAPLVRMHPDRGPDRVMHELGHVVEFSNPELFRKAVVFLDERATGRLIERDGGLVVEFIDRRAGDVGPGWYPRKFYERADSPNHVAVQMGGEGRTVDVTATEVISSAVEYMADPGRFFDRAPRFFWWTVDNVVLPD